MWLIIIVILPGCYTQLSRPRVDTQTTYYEPAPEDSSYTYYQDEGTEYSAGTGNVYIFNNYPYYWNGYYDFWHPSPYYWRDYYWGYIGPYPYYWWDPYAHWWVPGWYVGFSYYDHYWWHNYPRYYYHDGWRPSGTPRHYAQRPFSRHSPGVVNREQRDGDSQRSFSRPNPTRIERPPVSTATPAVTKQRPTPNRMPRADSDAIERKASVPRATDRDEAIPVPQTRNQTQER
ncbi:MAG: hypothetical protein ONB16_07920, partial [candidate division KSB1 bacterium]|nr:hypothetical protein [candidate division KSB1 bacterium]